MNKKINFSRYLIDIILLIILLLMTIIGVIYLYNSNHKVVIKKSFDHLISYKSYLNIPEYLKLNNQELIEGNIEFSINDKYKTLYKKNTNKYKFYNDIDDLKLNYKFYKNKNKSLYEITEINKDKQIIINNDSNNYYIYIKNMYDKYLKINKQLLTNDELNYFYNFCYDKAFNNINKKNYEIEKTSIQINKRKQIVKKTSIKLSENEIIAIINLTIKDINSNNKAKEIFSKIGGPKKIKKTNNNKEYEYIVYTKGIYGKIVGIDLNTIQNVKTYRYILKNSRYQKSKKYTLNRRIKSYKYRNENIDSLYIYDNSKLINKYQILKNSNIETLLVIYNDKLEKITDIKLINNPNKYQIKIDKDDDIEEAKYNILFEVNKDKVDFTMKSYIKDVYYDTESTDLKIIGGYTIKNNIDKKIPEIKQSILYKNQKLIPHLENILKYQK